MTCSQCGLTDRDVATVEGVPWCFDCYYAGRPEAFASRWGWQSRARQGIPAFIEDPVILARIVALLRS